MTPAAVPRYALARAALLSCFAAVIGVQAMLVWECAVGNPGKDWIFHTESAIQASQPGGRYHGHPLYHFLANLIAGAFGGAGDASITARSGAVLTILAIAARIHFTDRLACELLRSQTGGVQAWQRLLVLVVGAFASAAPNWWRFPQIYFGQFTPNLWFNSTHIVGQAFIAWFCWLLVRSRRTGLRDVWLASLGLAISVIAKPNFAFACIPALGLFAVLGHLRWRESLILGVPATVAVGLVALAYKGDGTGSGIEWAPFLIWNRRTPTKVGSFAVSFLFPLVFRALAPKRGSERDWSLAAWVVTLIALAQYALFAESGFRKFHANLEWGLHAAVWALLVASVTEWSSMLTSESLRREWWRHMLIGGALTAHLCGGAIHAVRAYQGADWKP